MIYSIAITVPANTGESNPVVETVKLSPGVLSQIEIDFPLGCAGLAHTQILHWDVKHWPSDPEQSFSANGNILKYNEPFNLDKSPFALILKCWNLDDTYPHTISFRFQIIDKSNNLIDVIKRTFLI